jgi:hypothetical protein
VEIGQLVCFLRFDGWHFGSRESLVMEMSFQEIGFRGLLVMTTLQVSLIERAKTRFRG